MLTLTVDQKDQIFKNFKAFVAKKSLASIKFDEVILTGEPCSLIAYRYQTYTLCLFIFDHEGSYSISVVLLDSTSENTFSKEFIDFTFEQILGLFTKECPLACDKFIQHLFKA